MIRFLAQRLTFALLLVLVVSSTALFLARLAPGDVTAQLGPFASAAEISSTRARFDLDRSPGAQWVTWLARTVRFDFGDSFLYNRPVRGLVLSAAVNTAVLAVAALASIYAELGYFDRSVLHNSRSFTSILNGHPGPVLPGVS